MSSIVLLLLDIEHCSIETVKNWKAKVYILILQNLGCGKNSAMITFDNSQKSCFYIKTNN